MIDCFINKCRKKEKMNFNSEFLIIYNNRQIRCFNLSKPFEDSYLMPLSLQVHEQNDQFNNQDNIYKVLTGSNPEKIVIIIEQTKFNDDLYIWNIVDDIELNSYDVGKNYNIIWDKNGDAYIV